MMIPMKQRKKVMPDQLIDKSQKNDAPEKNNPNTDPAKKGKKTPDTSHPHLEELMD
jgi:hypothetical protein